MNHCQERLEKLNEALLGNTYISSSEGVLHTFPEAFRTPYMVNGIGLIVCNRGGFRFVLDKKEYVAHAGETLFIPEYSFLQILEEFPGLEVFIFVYQVEPIRDIMGNLVLSMYPYSQLSAEPCYVWKTGEEEEVLKYMSLLESAQASRSNVMASYECKLLLLALTHRLCSIYSRKLQSASEKVGRKNEVFMKLIELIERYYMQERGVEFYADKLCLSPKYLSLVSKKISGYTVQELVFKAIVRKCISLLKNTQKTIQEISDEMNFPNASYFGTFFKKQTGFSPLQYRLQKGEGDLPDEADSH